MDEITNLRNLIDSVDNQILELINSRVQLVKEIGKLKKEKGIEVIDKNREQQIFNSLLEQAKSKGLDEDTIKKVWKNLIDLSYKIEGGK